MTDAEMQDVINAFSKTSVHDDGVTFKGKSLVLNTEKECDEVVEAIKNCKNLGYLNLEGNTLGVEASKAISKALETKSELKRALWMDMFTGRMKEEIPRALENLSKGLTIANAQLTELDLSDNAFGPIGVNGLAGLLSSQACYQLQVLKLNNNGLGSSGGKMLAEALLQCHKNSSKEGKTFALKLFVAGRNRLENEGATELAKVFNTLGTLEEIVMPQNGIYHKGIKALSDSFRNNCNLKVIDLNDNTITKKGAKHIAEILPYLQQLKVLNLGDCLLKTGGATVLANALADKHEHLEELHLSCNEIRSDGGLAVVKAMTNKTKLKHLNVNGNLFGTDGRKLLKEGLEENKKIETLAALNEDESCDENDDSEEGSGEENSDSENEENSDEEEKKPNSFVSPTENTTNSKECDSPVKTEIENFKQNKTKQNETSDVLSQILSSLAIKPNSVGPLKAFLDNPIFENFSHITEDKIYEFIQNNQDHSVEFYIDTFIPMLVKISSLSCCQNDDVVKLVSNVSNRMYKDLFTWAADKNQISTVNNALFVHLDLIKSEDKSFKINWDVKGSLEALRNAMLLGSVPLATQNILKCLLEKKDKQQHNEEITVN